MDKLDIVYSGKKIDHLVSKVENRIERAKLKMKLVECLGYTGIAIANAYGRLKNSKTPLGITGLMKISHVLEVNWFEILDDKHQKIISTIDILPPFTDENELNEFLFKLESDNDLGRIAIFNRFPSIIYYLDGVEHRKKRYDYLTKEAHKNHEYYSLRSVLEFGFSPLSEFKIEDRVKILNNVISSHGSANHAIRIIDNTKVSYPRTSSECEIIGKDTIIMQAPYYSNTILIIKSHTLVDKINNQLGERIGLTRNHDGIHTPERTFKFIKIMRDVIAGGGDTEKFLISLEKEKSQLLNSARSLLI